MTQAQAKIRELEKEKERLIHHYLGLQDQADALNEQIYHLCCDIEILNKRIEIAREEDRKLQARAQATAAGKGSPTTTPSVSGNGNGSGRAGAGGNGRSA